MLDLKWIRENPEALKKGLAAKNASFDVSKLLELDKKRLTQLQEVENLKSQRNAANEKVVLLKKSGKNDEANELIASMKSISQNIKEIDSEMGELSTEMDNLLMTIPNIPHESVPITKTPEENPVVRTWGEPKNFSFKPLTQMELGTSEKNPYFSMDWGSKITGSGFPVYRGAGARLERALINFMIEMHAQAHGYEEIWPPALVNRDSMTGTGQLPKFEEDMYKLKDEDFYLVPTAEVPVTNLLRNQTLQESDLPIKFVAYSPCFRREAGSYGKDTKGLSRVHQFDKIEMVKFVKPENAHEELESLTGNAEAILQALGLPYRVLLLGSGDMSFSSSKCYDLEVWAPGTGKWFEVSSCSTFGDFQARRMNIRFKRNGGGKPEYVHTLNGSGVALARTFLCLLENYQKEDGSVELPEVLKKYL